MKNECEKIEIIEYATITYNDGTKQPFDAIRVTNEGVNIGRIYNNNYVEYDFIPNDIIRAIDMGKSRKIRRKISDILIGI